MVRVMDDFAPVTLRPLPADTGTEAFLRPFLGLVVNWLDVRPALSEEAIATDDVLNGYVAGWGREGDLALGAWTSPPSSTTAQADTSEQAADRGELIGAAWLRLPTEDWSGHGYVARDIPELAMAVVPEYRGGGTGRRLLTAVVSMARMAGHPSLSVSVEDGNDAATLYASLGFTVVGRSGTADTLLLSL